MRRILTPLLLLGAISLAQAKHNILDYGAVANTSDTESAFTNSKAFISTLQAANSSATDREVYIPGEYETFFTFMPIYMNYIKNITFTIDGVIQLSEDNLNWPVADVTGKNSILDFWRIEDSQNLHIKGTGRIEGQGYWWWMREYVV